MTNLFVHLYAKHQHSFSLHNYKLEVYHYDYIASKPFYDKDKKKQTDFNTNQLRIAYATARTLCSYHLDKQELYFDIVASLLSQLNFITQNSKDYLQIFESRYERLRDFSKSTRIGELAQGINALFVQEELDYIYIVDFHYFYEKIYGKSFGKGSTPDFVALSENYKELALFESKGEGSKNKNVNGKYGKLYGALQQLTTITKPCAKKLIPICTRFENDSKDAKNSAIHYSLVKKVCKDSFTALRIFRMHYASWFYLVGDFTRATQLLQESGFDTITNGETTGNIIYELGTDNRDQEVFWVRLNPEIDWFSKALNFQLKGYVDLYFTNFRIGIYRSVIEQLANNNLNNENAIELTNDEEYQRFADRTIIKIGKTEKQ